MEVPKGYKLIKQNKMDQITEPYALLPCIHENLFDQTVLKRWADWFIEGNHPFCIIKKANKYKMIVQKDPRNKCV